MGYKRSIIKDKLKDLMALPIGWDGYRGIPLKEENAMLLTDILDIIEDEDYVPQIVPSSDGGLQIEWHDRKMTIEILIRSASDITIDIERS